jgi:hypothetical protein
VYLVNYRLSEETMAKIEKQLRLQASSADTWLGVDHDDPKVLEGGCPIEPACPSPIMK